MEVQTLDIGDGETVRFYERGDDKWFCLTDICRCLDMKKKAVSNYSQRIDKSQIESRKVLAGTAERPVNFICEDAACQMVFKSRSRSEKGKNMKIKLLGYLKGRETIKKARKIQPKDKEYESENDEDKDESVNEEENKIVKSPVHKEERKDVVTVYNPFVASSTTDPKIASMYFETERYKADLQYKLKEKQLELAKKEADIKQWQFCNKKIFKYGTSMEKERFLNHARMIGDRLLVDYLPTNKYL